MISNEGRCIIYMLSYAVQSNSLIIVPIRFIKVTLQNVDFTATYNEFIFIKIRRFKRREEQYNIMIIKRKTYVSFNTLLRFVCVDDIHFHC